MSAPTAMDRERLLSRLAEVLREIAITAARQEEATSGRKEASIAPREHDSLAAEEGHL